MKKLPLFALLFLSGCYATAQPMFLPDGTSGYEISCGTYLGDTVDCIKKASDVCGANGYQSFDQTGRLKNDDAQNQAVIAALNTSGAKSAKSSDSPHSMFVKCKSPDAPLRLAPAPTPPIEKPVIPLEPPRLAPAAGK